eukprot:5241066-Prymnesium_polylepis.1
MIHTSGRVTQTPKQGHTHAGGFAGHVDTNHHVDVMSWTEACQHHHAAPSPSASLYRLSQPSVVRNRMLRRVRLSSAWAGARAVGRDV